MTADDVGTGSGTLAAGDDGRFGTWTGTASGLNAANGRSALGLGSAALSASAAFATAAQGATADSVASQLGNYALTTALGAYATIASLAGYTTDAEHGAMDARMDVVEADLDVVQLSYMTADDVGTGPGTLAAGDDSRFGTWTGTASGLNAANGRSALGLGSAALSASTAFATAAQGATADSVASQLGSYALTTALGAYATIASLAGYTTDAEHTAMDARMDLVETDLDVVQASYGTGSVTQVAASGGLTGGPITTSGTLSIADNGVNSARLASDVNGLSKVTAGVMTALADTKVGIGTPSPQTTLDVNGGVRAGRIENSQEAYTSRFVFTANGAWHTIYGGLSGHQLFEITADYGTSCQHAVAHWFTGNTYASTFIDGASTPGHGLIPLELRWLGSTYDMTLQIRTASNVVSCGDGSTPPIIVRVRSHAFD